MSHPILDATTPRSWTTLDPEPGTAKQHAKRVTNLAPLARGALDGLTVQASDQDEERTTAMGVGAHTRVVEADEEEGISDTVLEGLNSLLGAVGAAPRFAWADRAAGLVVCVTTAELDALRAAGMAVEAIGDGEEEAEEGGVSGWRRPTRADVPGTPDGASAKVESKGMIGPITLGGAADVAFDAAGAVTRITAKRGPLTVEATLAGATLTVTLKGGRAEFSDHGWRAWGALGKDLTAPGVALHATDEVDIENGAVCGIVFTVDGTWAGRAKKAGAAVDVAR